MSVGSTLSRARRRVALALVAFAVAVAGLGAVPGAQAAGNPTYEGAGAERTQDIAVSAGLFQVDLSYSGNTSDSGATDFVASLQSESGTFNVPLADDVASEGRVRRIVRVPSATSLHVMVNVAATVAVWDVTLAKLTEPTVASSTLSVKGSGSTPSELRRLTAGTYSVTTGYSGNSGADVTLTLRGGTGTSTVLVSSNASSRSVTSTVKIATTGTYWVDADAAAATTWSVKMTRLLSLSAAPTPKISGTAKVGKKLTAKPGTWKPSGVKLTYQWKRSGATLKGATKSTYTLTKSDKGKKITVTVTGSKSGYLTAAKTSKSTSAVKK